MKTGEGGGGETGLSCEKVISARHFSVPVMLCADAN